MQRATSVPETNRVLDGFRKWLFGGAGRGVRPFAGRAAGAGERPDRSLVDALRVRIRELECERDNLLAERETRGSHEDRSGGYLEKLEAALSDPGRAHNVIVYYQLRGLWDICRREIGSFVQELAKRCEKREREALLERFREEQDHRLKDFRDQLHWLDIEREHLVNRRRELAAELEKHRMPWHFGCRKKLRSDMAVVDDRFPPLDDRRRHLLGQIEATRDRSPPAYSGLGIQARRHVNLSAIALAQYFYLYFLEDDIGALARAAHEKPPDRVEFGTPAECESLAIRIGERAKTWHSDSERMKKISRRARFLAARARYASDNETVPTTESMGVIVTAISGTGSGMQDGARRLPVNVLEFDYWNVSESLV